MIALPQNASGAVITFDEATDGTPIEDDVTLDAERVVLYGNGPDKTILASSSPQITLVSEACASRAISRSQKIRIIQRWPLPAFMEILKLSLTALAP